MVEAKFDAAAHVALMETALGLTIGPDWRPAVIAHLAAIARAGDLVMAFDLPEGVEPAPVYVP
jgi:hypothetical protein